VHRAGVAEVEVDQAAGEKVLRPGIVLVGGRGGLDEGVELARCLLLLVVEVVLQRLLEDLGIHLGSWLRSLGGSCPRCGTLCRGSGRAGRRWGRGGGAVGRRGRGRAGGGWWWGRGALGRRGGGGAGRGSRRSRSSGRRGGGRSRRRAGRSGRRRGGGLSGSGRRRRRLGQH